LIATSPAIVFGLKMAFCLALFLLGAAWLRRFAERVKDSRGLPPGEASAIQAVSHYLGKSSGPAPQIDLELRLYRQTIRLLIKELERLDPANEEAREADRLLRQTPAGNRGPADPLSASAGRPDTGSRRSDADPQEAGHPVKGSGSRWSRERKRAMTATAALLLALLASSGQRAAAQAEPSRCDEANAGRAETQAGVRCVCVHSREGNIAQTPSGWRWDCSILRSRTNADVEASPGGYDGALPSSVYVDEGWYDMPEDRGHDGNGRKHDRNDRKKAGKPRGREHDTPHFHDRAMDRFSRGDHPDWMSPPGGR
jgi:hypothetical protein